MTRNEWLYLSVLGLAACGGSPGGGISLAGTWRSAEVRLTGPGRDEGYRFAMVVNARDPANVAGELDLEYASAGRPDERRVLRQELALVVDAAAGILTITGRDAVLVSGPELVGVYEPDSFTCTLPDRATPDRLSCRWGSDAHGVPPEVVFTRVTG